MPPNANNYLEAFNANNALEAFNANNAPKIILSKRYKENLMTTKLFLGLLKQVKGQK